MVCHTYEYASEVTLCCQPTSISPLVISDAHHHRQTKETIGREASAWSLMGNAGGIRSWQSHSIQRTTCFSSIRTPMNWADYSSAAKRRVPPKTIEWASKVEEGKRRILTVLLARGSSFPTHENDFETDRQERKRATPKEGNADQPAWKTVPKKPFG